MSCIPYAPTNSDSKLSFLKHPIIIFLFTNCYCCLSCSIFYNLSDKQKQMTDEQSIATFFCHFGLKGDPWLLLHPASFRDQPNLCWMTCLNALLS
nr:hypothetical protein [Tanacetum cinerariifolium]